MAVIKRVLCPRLLRKVPSQFSWIDHRLVRDRHICRCSHPALSLYLFLVCVCDGQGLSYYSDASIMRLLKLDPLGLARARQELINARLIAHQCPLYQVLALEASARQAQAQPTAGLSNPVTVSSPDTHPTPRTSPPEPGEPTSQPQTMGQILRQMMEGTP